MNYNVLGIGYLPAKYESTYEKWGTHDVDIVFADSALQADQLLKEKQFCFAIFHSRMLDNIPYINVMRSNKTVPFLILTSQCMNTKQAKLAIQYILQSRDLQSRDSSEESIQAFTYGDLYFCQHYRIVRVREEVLN